MKRLYEFSLYKAENVKEKSESTNDKGEKVVTEKEVEKKVEHRFFLRKPTRSMYDEAELFYGVKLAEGVKAGLLNHALLAKRYNNDGGIFSEEQKEDFANSYFELLNDQTDWQQLTLKGDERSKSEDDKLEKLERKMSLNRRKLQAYETDKSSLFDQTAETRARNKTVFWWVMNMSYTDEKDPTLVFKGETHEDRLAAYDVMEDTEDTHIEELIHRLVYYVSFWYAGRVTDPEEFKALEEGDDLGITLSKPEAEEEPAKEGSAKEKPVEEKPKKKPVKKAKKKEKAPVEEFKKDG